jgi:hypothetical protein
MNVQLIMPGVLKPLALPERLTPPKYPKRSLALLRSFVARVIVLCAPRSVVLVDDLQGEFVEFGDEATELAGVVQPLRLRP